MDLLTVSKRLNDLSFDDFISILYTFSDDYGFLSSNQMLSLDVITPVSLHVTDFLDLFLYSRLANGKHND